MGEHEFYWFITVKSVNNLYTAIDYRLFDETLAQPDVVHVFKRQCSQNPIENNY